MKKKYFITLIVLLIVSLSFGQSIFTNPITDPNPSLSNPFIAGQIADANITVSGIGRGVGIGPNTGLNRYNARGWNTAALDNTAYFEFILTPNATYAIDFISFVYTSQRSNASIANFVFRSSIDGFTADIGAPDFNGITIDLSGATFQNITTPITFRFYAWGASSPANTFSINDFTFNGSMTTCISTTTWNGVGPGWDNGTPISTTEAIIAAPYDTAVSGSFDACSLIVNAGAANILSIQNGDYVQVTNDIVIDGAILVASEANLVQLNDASNVTLNGTGIGTLAKTTTPIDAFYEYTYWSSPMDNETIATALTGVPANRIFEYDAGNYNDTNNDGFDDNANDWSVASGPMIPGKGYAAFARPATMSYPETQTFNFNGEFNNGLITPNVTVSPGPNPLNWNFLGNPYPSGLDAVLFVNDPANSNLGGTLYFWTHISPPDGGNQGPSGLNFSEDDYASYTVGSGGVAAINDPAMSAIPTQIVASGQGFFIEASAGGTATFNNAMRVTTGNDNFFRATDRIWLNFENDYGAFSQILVAFVEGATNGVDRLYDGRRLDGGSYISFFSLIENDEEHYAIQGREALTEEEMIPLGIKNLVEGANEYKISIDTIEGVLETSEVFLVDNLLNITHDLNLGEYRFNSEQGIYENRFELLLKSTLPEEPFVKDELVIVKETNESLVFSTTNKSDIASIQIFDVLGRLLYDIAVNQEQDPSYRLDNLNQTIFIAKATLTNGRILTKKGLK